MTMDRNAYVTYLEAQLERVTSTCMTVQSFGERIDQLSGQVTSVEERIVNLTRLIKLLQSSNEAHEQDGVKMTEGIKELKMRVDSMDSQQIKGPAATATEQKMVLIMIRDCYRKRWRRD